MEKVSLWWDMAGCPLPAHMDPFVVRSMANSLLESFNLRGSGIGHQFTAYKYPSANEDDIELGQTMFNSAIHLQLVQPALVGNSNEIEKMITADMLLWAIDVPPPGDIILIIGNVDFSYAIRKLRERSYNVFLVCSSIVQVPPGMLSAANDCLGWLPFLHLLEQNEEKLQFPSNVQGWGPEYYQAFSPAYKRSSSTVSSKECEEYQTRSSFGYISENSFTGQSSFNDGWDSSQFSVPPLYDAATARVQQPQGPGFQGHGNKSTVNPMDHAENKREHKRPTDTKPKKKVASMGEFRAWLRQTVNSKENENGYNISPIRKDFEKASGKILDFAFLGFPKVLNLLDQCKGIAEVKEVKKGCHLAFPVKTIKENPHKLKKPNPNPKPTREKPENSRAGMNTNEAEHKSMPKASERDFYFFLLQMVSTGEFAQGFLMSQLRQKFESISGKCLDVQHLGYQKLTNLVEVYSNLVSLDKTGGGHQRVYPAGSVRETVLNPNLCRASEEIPFNMVDNVTEQEAKLEMDHPSTSISVQASENNAWKDSLSCKNLYNLDSELDVAEREWPSMGLYTSPFVSLTATEPFTGLNKVNVCKQEAKAEVDNPSAHGSILAPENKAWKDNISYKLLSYPNSELGVTESEWPSTLPFVNSTLTEPLMGFQDYSNKSDSSGTPQGSQVSELEGQFSNMISEYSSRADSCQLERSEYVKQSLSSLQSEEYMSIGNTTNAETLQNMRENKLFCKEVIRSSETATNQNSSCSISFGRELLDSVSTQLEPPLKESEATCNIPLAPSPLQSLPQESVVCSKTSQDETRLDSKQSEQNTKSAVNEEGNVHTIVSPAESIIQVAGRGLKSIYDFSIWRKGQ
ncbi:uncharacterized protein LOC131073390 [Cryptomeria japonica]|uniref:uncharacterized protein LOC131073390 n=1 Tax=Cryptomeria japonica TaxID=3369 RepID=UPI0025AC38D9|nr:uncharacterized protein LOC131073390 [Cryptomeria japonica]